MRMGSGSARSSAHSPTVSRRRALIYNRPVSIPPGGAQMAYRSFLMAVALVVLLAVTGPTPALAAQEGTMTLGIHVTLVSRWLDPGDTEGLITPFMVLYALHDPL